MPQKQKGFSVVEIVIVVAIIALACFIGWLVWNNATSQKTASNTGQASTNDAQTSGATKYLEIKEWGVKFALTADTADAYYDSKTSSPLDSMSLRSHSLDAVADCTTAPQSVASIFRVPKNAQSDDQPGKTYAETQEGQTIGDYFYFIQSSQYSCTDSAALQTTLQGVRNSFNTASTTIQKI